MTLVILPIISHSLIYRHGYRFSMIALSNEYISADLESMEERIDTTSRSEGLLFNIMLKLPKTYIENVFGLFSNISCNRQHAL